MTESPARPAPEYKPSPQELAELVEGMGNLAREVKHLADQQELDREAAAADVGSVRRKQRRDRILVTVAIVGLVLDLCLSGLFWRQHVQQACLNGLRAASAKIADSDRANVDAKLAADAVLFAADAKFFSDVFSSTTSAQARHAFQVHVKAVDANEAAAAHYAAVRKANDEKRAQLGTGDADTCSLF